MYDNPLFSVIVPAYNAEVYLSGAIASVEQQSFQNYELLIVDDASTDDTCKQVCLQDSRVELLHNSITQGPGIARNHGLDKAKGQYIIFLDADDELAPDALWNLAKVIEEEGSFDICDFNGLEKIGNKVTRRRERDMQVLHKKRQDIVRAFLCLQIDMMVIYTCFSKAFLDKHSLRFPAGIHEDVQFLFSAYLNAETHILLDDICYIKHERSDSIIHTCSRKHVADFFSGWEAVHSLFGQRKDLFSYWRQGLVAIGAVKTRDVLQHKDLVPTERDNIYRLIASQVSKYYPLLERNKVFQTRYFKLLACVEEYAQNFVDYNVVAMVQLEERLTILTKESWGCWDVCHSIFMASDELRACCKRFFLEGEKKGDVILTKLLPGMSKDQIYKTYTDNQAGFLARLNSGAAEECMGCPYLQYKGWSKNLKKISFEYHSVCNLRCEYCGPKYYGGMRPEYDILGFVESLIEHGLLTGVENVTWGGGEPSLDKFFPELLRLVAYAAPQAKHTIISNGTRYEPAVQELLNQHRAILITSLDAGTKKTYQCVRHGDYFDEVLRNLSIYADHASGQVYVKYIILADNRDLDNLQGFVRSIIAYGLSGCTFEISCDFNAQELTPKDRVAVIALFCLLREAGVDVIFLDELLRERLVMDTEELTRIRQELQHMGIKNHVYQSYSHPVVIWGSDNQVRTLLDKSVYFENCKPLGLIAGHDSILGHKCFEYEYCSPDKFIRSDIRLIIASVQGTRRIYEKALEIGYRKDQIITDIIL